MLLLNLESIRGSNPVDIAMHRQVEPSKRMISIGNGRASSRRLPSRNVDPQLGGNAEKHKGFSIAVPQPASKSLHTAATTVVVFR